MTVPPSDLVLNANQKVGMAARNAGFSISIMRGVPVVKSSGASRALKIETGIKLSHSTSQSGNLRVDINNKGSHLGI